MHPPTDRLVISASPFLGSLQLTPTIRSWTVCNKRKFYCFLDTNGLNYSNFHSSYFKFIPVSQMHVRLHFLIPIQLTTRKRLVPDLDICHFVKIILYLLWTCSFSHSLLYVCVYKEVIKTKDSIGKRRQEFFYKHQSYSSYQETAKAHFH